MENKKRYSSDELSETDNLIRKYKVDFTTTIDNDSKAVHHETDITEKELNKFLLVFNLLIEANEEKDSGEVTDAEDGIPDILMLITTELLELSIDSLSIPNILKKSLKKLKEHIFKQKNVEKEIRSTAKRHYSLRANPARAAVAAAVRAQAATAAPSAAAAAAAAPVARPTQEVEEELEDFYFPFRE